MADPSQHRQHGGAGKLSGVWVVVAVVIVAALVALALFMRMPPSPSAGPPTAEDYATLEALQTKLRTAIANQRPATPLLGEAQNLVARHPDMTEARVTLAQIQMLTDHRPAAYEQFTEALRQNPDQAQVQQLTGSLLMDMDRPVEAEPHYRAAVALEPTTAQHRVLLAQALVKQDRVDEAERVLVETIGIDNTQHAAHGLLSDIYAQQGQTDLALSQAQKARKGVPRERAVTWAAYTRRYAKLLRDAGQPAESLLVLRELPPETHFDPAVAAEMAVCWKMLGEPEKAAAHYEEALRLNPLDEASVAQAVKWYREADDQKNAQRMIDELRRINPRSPRLAELEATVANNQP